MIASWPMQEEATAVGRVSDVYRDIRRYMPLVPSPYKSMAISPMYLELAWLQSRSEWDALDVLATELAQLGTERIRDADAACNIPKVAASVRDVGCLVPRMLLTVEYLGMLLAGELAEMPRPSGLALPASIPQEGVPPLLSMSNPDVADGDTRRIYGDMQVAYEIPFVSSVFRVLATEGLLDQAWDASRSFQTTEPGQALAMTIQQDADALLLRSLPTGFAGQDALREAGIEDALGSLRQLLAIYRHGIPKVLTFVLMMVPNLRAEPPTMI